MEDSNLLSKYLGAPFRIVLKEPAGEQIVGALVNLVPLQHIILERGR